MAVAATNEEVPRHQYLQVMRTFEGILTLSRSFAHHLRFVYTFDPNK